MPPVVETQYLGRVTRAPASGDAYRFASVKPIVESDPMGNEWIGPVRDALSRFPKRGLVHWHAATAEVRDGSLWQFSIDEHPFTGRPEQFQVKGPMEPIEVLDLRGWSDEALLRTDITGRGISLSPAPMAKRVLLWLASGVCVGPLLLKPAAEEGLWMIDAPEEHRDAARMPVWVLSPTDINRVPIDGGRWFVSPRLELGRSAGIQNWAPDIQVARSILGRLRRMDPDVVKAIGATDSLFREYLHHVETGRMGSADPAVERARADRLRGIREAIQRDTALLLEAVQTLLATVEIRAEVDRRVETLIREVVEARQSEKSEVNTAIAGAREQLARLQEEVDTKCSERAALDAAVSDKKRELEEKVASFDREVTARLEEIARRPAEAFAEAAIMRALLAPSVSKPVSDVDRTPPQSPASRSARASDQTPTEPIAQLRDPAAVRAALASKALAGPLSIHAMLGLHAAFVVGAVPVVIGSDGYELLRAYATSVAGGRLHWIPIGSSTVEPQDLLGRFDGMSRRILPSISGLLEVVHDATQSGSLHVVVLEGFNRAPVEAYLAPILEAALAGRTGDRARAIPIANRGFLAEGDPYSALARLAWPPNALIACLPSDGTATLPVPSSAWRFLALLDADDRDRVPVPAAPPGAPGSITEIAPSLWKDCMANASSPIAADIDSFAALARALSVSLRDAADAARVRDFLCVNQLPVADATALAVAAILIPRTSAGAKVVEEAIRSMGISIPGWQTIRAESHRLRS